MTASRARRWRTAVVLLLLLGALVYAGLRGAGLLWADRPDRVVPVTCWDGSQADPGACTEPTGEAGLRWVFPGFRPRDAAADCQPVQHAEDPADPDRPRPLEVACTTELANGEVTLTYSRRLDVAAGLDYLRRLHGAAPVKQAGGSQLVFRDPAERDGAWSLTVAYAAHPFSVTVTAPDRPLREEALRDLVTLRPASQVTVRPAPAS